ncbi:MAG: sensor domain-containing diguanylate cyclase [Rhodospirillales bacterium]|nr:sensor domain-containing diguanylate cyclase [Rhodospirillales bacterium]
MAEKVDLEPAEEAKSAALLKSKDDAEILLAGYPGAALLITRDCSVERANAKGEGLEALIVHGAIPEIRDLVNKSEGVHTVTATTVTLPSAKGEIILDLTVVPVESGRFLVLARDQTMEKNLRSALVESRQRYKDLVEISSDFCWETSVDGEFQFVSPKGAIGYTADELVNAKAETFIVNPENFTPLPFASRRPLDEVEIWFSHKNGSQACMMLSCVPLYSEAGGTESWCGTRGVCRDVTIERENETALTRARNREQILSYIVSMIRDELEPENMLSAAATASTRALEVAGCRIYRLAGLESFGTAAEYGNTADTGDLNDNLDDLGSNGEVKQFRTGNWTYFVVATHYRNVINGAIGIWISEVSDTRADDLKILLGDIANQLGIANEQIANHERIVALSRTDGMTGLLNRRAFFEEELPRRLSRLARSRETAALFYVDMDNFKKVNDVHGHQAGDDAILFLRDLLMDFSRPGDVIARLGGDEFAMWLDGISPEVTQNRAGALITASQAMAQYSGDPAYPLGISVGVAVYDPKDEESFDGMLARADEAMYAVKKAGKGGFMMAPAPKAD